MNSLDFRSTNLHGTSARRRAAGPSPSARFERAADRLRKRLARLRRDELVAREPADAAPDDPRLAVLRAALGYLEASDALDAPAVCLVPAAYHRVLAREAHPDRLLVLPDDDPAARALHAEHSPAYVFARPVVGSSGLRGSVSVTKDGGRATERRDRVRVARLHGEWTVTAWDAVEVGYLEYAAAVAVPRLLWLHG